MYVSDSPSLPRRGRLMLLAPSAAHVPPAFDQIDVNVKRHDALLAGVQRLRGCAYLQDGAILPSQLTADGRHVMPKDNSSWHVVSVQPDGKVVGCARYLPHAHDVSPEAVGVWSSALARHEAWGQSLWGAVEGDLALARRRNVAYVEVGGWAIAEELRFTWEAMQVALSTYALAETIGGCIGITTATVRHRSSTILRKIGGQSLEFRGCRLPAYYDPHYRCEMEILRFESSSPNPKYRRKIEGIVRDLINLPVICSKVGNKAGNKVGEAHLPSAALRRTEAHA